MCLYYINELSESLSKLPVGCCCGNTVVNHLMYADNIVLFAPSAKGLQKTINVCYAYGCDNLYLSNTNSVCVCVSRLKSQVVSLQTAHSWANAGVLLGDACIGSGVAFEAIKLLG